ncbi:MAG TPA: hypothetical protein VNF29_10000, partial [Candidatus Binataceae bacterium]|nr:hypothetical protein [Candidatus Binataceae bacterium]
MLLNNRKLFRGAALLAVCLCGALGGAMLSAPASGAAVPSESAAREFTARFRARLAQSGSASDDQAEVPPDQVEKYIAVYKATQSTHSLTVEQAATQQGLTVAQFR